MSDVKPIRILIVDDHPIVREGIAALIELREDMTVVAQGCHGGEAIELFKEHRPDVTLMDLRMPTMDGVTAISRIRGEYPNARIIILTTYGGDEDIYSGLRVGAKGYMLKDAPREQIFDAIRAVHAGQTRIPVDVAAKLAERLNSPELTPREREVLHHIVEGHSNQEIGGALYITEGTVKAHVNSILNKLEVSDRTQAMGVALKRGIVHLP